MKNEVCSRILFAPQCGKQCRKAMSDLGKMPYRWKSTKWTFARFGISGHKKNYLPSNSKNGVGIPKSHIHAINGQKSKLEIWLLCSDKLETQWYYLCLKRVYIIYRKTSSAHEDGIISFWQEHIPYVIRMKQVSWKLYRKIVLCYLVFLEVYAHLYVGLHDDDDAGYWP